MVYFMKRVDGDLVKIGYSGLSVLGRVKGVESSGPLKVEIVGVMDGDRMREKEVHRMFVKQRVAGEWFLYDDEVAQFVANNTTTDVNVVHDRSGMSIRKMIDFLGEDTAKHAFVAAGYKPDRWGIAIKNNWVIDEYRYHGVVRYFEKIAALLREEYEATP